MEKREESQYCSKFFKTFLLFEYIRNDLSEEIAAKVIEEIHFQEEDIWFFLYCVLSGLLYYKAYNLAHGDLQPKNIFISQNGFFKISDHTLFNNSNSYSQIQWNPSASHTNIYLSPILVHSLAKELVQPLHNPFKSDIFTLGMITLHIATRENCDQCYDYQRNVIRNEEIDKKLKILNEKYGEKLFFFVKGMLIEDETDRPDYEDLMNMFNGSYNYHKDHRFREVHSF